MCGAAVEQKEETEFDGRNLAHKYVRVLFYRVHGDMATTLPCSNSKFLKPAITVHIIVDLFVFKMCLRAASVLCFKPRRKAGDKYAPWPTASLYYRIRKKSLSEAVVLGW